MGRQRRKNDEHRWRRGERTKEDSGETSKRRGERATRSDLRECRDGREKRGREGSSERRLSNVNANGHLPGQAGVDADQPSASRRRPRPGSAGSARPPGEAREINAVRRSCRRIQAVNRCVASGSAGAKRGGRGESGGCEGRAARVRPNRQPPRVDNICIPLHVAVGEGKEQRQGRPRCTTKDRTAHATRGY